MFLVDQYGGKASRKAEKNRSSKSKSYSTGSSHSHSRSVSFLFVVNILAIYPDNVDDGDQDYNRDQWLNLLPPRHHSGYTGERASPVMRYKDGQVTLARGYEWFRPAWHENGHFLQLSYQKLLEPYKHHAVFACNPHLPIVVMPGDPTTTQSWDLSPVALHFFHSPEPELSGISFATTQDGDMPYGPPPRKWVAGRHPTWIPSLVPATYTNQMHSPHPPSSRGLAGELPIIIGLMAFSHGHNAVEDVFVGHNGGHGLWHNRHWYSNHPPALYPPSEYHKPYGFYVAVALDPENQAISSSDRIYSFEWEGAIIKENAPSSSSSKRR